MPSISSDQPLRRRQEWRYSANTLLSRYRTALVDFPFAVILAYSSDEGFDCKACRGIARAARAPRVSLLRSRSAGDHGRRVRCVNARAARDRGETSRASRARFADAEGGWRAARRLCQSGTQLADVEPRERAQRGRTARVRRARTRIAKRRAVRVCG